jgi:hypothetical protein
MSKVELVKRLLREYQNDVIEIYEFMNDDGLSMDEAEKSLIILDEDYANRIAKLC